MQNIKCGGRKKNNEASVSGRYVNSGSLSLCVHCMTEKAELWQVWSRSWTVWLKNKYLSLKVGKKSKLWSSMNISETRSNLKHSRVKKEAISWIVQPAECPYPVYYPVCYCRVLEVHFHSDRHRRYRKQVLRKYLQQPNEWRAGTATKNRISLNATPRIHRRSVLP